MPAETSLRCLCLLLIAALAGCASVRHDRPAHDSAGEPVTDILQPHALSVHDPHIALDDSLQDSAEALPGPMTEGPAVQTISPDSAVDSVPETVAESDVEPVVDTPADASASMPIHDPWESFNRRVHRFNAVVDKAVAKPVTKAYVAAVPAPVRGKVQNFFDNLSQPATAANALLQGRVRHSADALGRFLLNSTVGIAGLFDPATRLKMPERDEDFGQTLAHWGWRRSRYIVLPFLGPKTLRDLVGVLGDSPLQPLSRVEDGSARIGFQALGLVDARSRSLSLESFRDNVQDDYLLIRDVWTQRRNFEIEQGAEEATGLPDYLKE